MCKNKPPDWKLLNAEGRNSCNSFSYHQMPPELSLNFEFTYKRQKLTFKFSFFQ